MKKLASTLREKKSLSLTRLLTLIVSILIFSSCYIETNHVGFDGRPGDAYLSLEWEYEAPTYLDAGTSDIPSVFTWGRYYLTRPGFYNLYYEGELWDGYDIAYYAWEIDYEIWRNPGAPGRLGGINGADGRDSYLTIILSPYGPFTDSMNKSLSKYKVIEEGKDKIVVEQKAEEFSIRITYKKVEKRSKSK